MLQNDEAAPPGLLATWASAREVGLDVVDWLRHADDAGVPVLGICFGAQALAVAHGGRVARLAAPEIAWIGLDSSDERAVPSGPWMAAHEDTITLPPLAYELARTAAGVQAFSIGRHLGVQFHPEVTPAILSSWLAADPARLVRAGVERAALEHQTRQLAAAAGVSARRLFDSFAMWAGLPFHRSESADGAIA